MGLSQHRWQGLKGVSPFARRLYYTPQEFVYIVVVPIKYKQSHQQPQLDIIKTANKPQKDSIKTSFQGQKTSKRPQLDIIKTANEPQKDSKTDIDRQFRKKYA